jgi:hypothetical protein
MRLLTVGLVTALSAFGCNRADSATAAKTPEALAANSATATATTGTAAAPAAPANRDIAAATPAASAVPATDVRPAEAAAPAAAWREVIIPAGTALPVVLDTTVGSDISRVEQPVHAHLARGVVVHGATVLPAGSAVTGVVTNAVRSGKVKGRAHIAMRFESLTPRGDDERYRIRTSAVGRTAPATKKQDAAKIGAPAAGGAVIGAIVGGKKGAAIGGAVGGGGGTAVVLSTRGKEVHMGKGSVVTVRLTEPLTVKVRS